MSESSNPDSKPQYEAISTMNSSLAAKQLVQNPMYYSVIYILLIETLERFTYYGLTFTQYQYITGEYNSEWNAGFTAVQASSFTSSSAAITYTLPFVGGILADLVFGDFNMILIGLLGCYFPGLIMIAYTAFPSQKLHSEYPLTVLKVAMLVLVPAGAGMIKSVVNVFGAKQFQNNNNSLSVQELQIKEYYVNFYMAINIGALLGGFIIPILAQKVSVGIAYCIPVVCLILALVLFLYAKPRFIIPKKFKRKSLFEDAQELKQLLKVIPITSMIVPFAIVYNQMYTVYNAQGCIMKKEFYGYVDASLMTNVDAISVLICGYFVGQYLYPFLHSHKIAVPLTFKFALGTGFGLCSLLFAIFVDYKIHVTYPKKISIYYQVFQYLFVGMGEIFTFSASYDASFVIAPTKQKGLASAINLFFIGGASNLVCIVLYKSCSHWFVSQSGDLQEYVLQGKIYNYLWVLVAISISGIAVNIFWKDYFEEITNKKSYKKKSSSLEEEYKNSVSIANIEQQPLIQ